MAEIKNSFLRSKMNKDLDDRLIPNGEYRDAQNISVGKSEADDIGALENILGNVLVPITYDEVSNAQKLTNQKNVTITAGNEKILAGMTISKADGSLVGVIETVNNSTDFTCINNLAVQVNNLDVLTFSLNTDVEAISYFADDNNSTIYLFLTNNTYHYIYKYFNNIFSPLVQGSFLNFNKSNIITGINLVENLLFFTDNLNQPRKINVTKSLGYYTQESDISVAKYNPYQPLEVMKKVEVVADAVSSGTTINIPAANANILPGMLLVSSKAANGQAGITAGEYIYVTANAGGTAITINVAPALAVAVGDTLIFVQTTMTGENISPFFNDVQMPGTPNWPGDPDYLENKFVRFSYRFQFDDKEYSLMAPFSQPTFIPKQKGYFLGSGGGSPKTKDENDAYISTVVEFFENGVQDIDLIIPLPDVVNNLGIANSDTYKIVNLDILYKESDQQVVKVIDTINIGNATGNTDTFTYNYISSKPYKTLPQRQTVRVYDKVPVKALSQEVSGNRVMYGNFQSQHTPPSSIDYQVGANEKSAPTTGETVTEFFNWVEYPNHTLKQNRNYQVGFILSDKYGRQSSVILSSNDTYKTSGSIAFGGSTIYHPYRASTQNLKEWWGDALKVLVNESITSNTVNDGEPGLYAVPEGNGFNISAVAQLNTAVTIPILNVAGFEYEFTLTGSATNVPTVGEYLRGEYTDYVEVVEVDASSAPVYEVYTKKPINEFLYGRNILNTPDTKFAYTLPNPLGWYSYKIVVKQQEQDYYNVYLPGIVKGYPDQTGVTPKVDFPTTPTGSFISNMVLINDNINKIPRDLSEVGPEQKQFRSSVRLFGRVQNTMVANSASNIQYFPGIKSDTAITIAAGSDANMAYDLLGDGTNTSLYSSLSTTGQASMYQLDSNPLIARLSTSADIGAVSDNTANSMVPCLAIYETEPVDSVLQLFYETSTSGLIADLNADVETGFDGVAGLESLSYSQNENMAANTDVTAEFRPQNNQGSPFNNTAISTGYPQITVVDGSGVQRASGDINNPSGDFKIVTSNTGYKLQTNTNSFIFGSDGATKEVYTIQLTWRVDATGDVSTTTSIGSLTNIAPEFTAGASLPDVTVSVTATAVVTRNGNNGSNSNSIAGLKYSITSGNTGNYFTIASTTGVITKSASTPIGVYNLTLKIEDAVLNGIAQTGSLNISKTQKVTVGANTINSSAKSTCRAVGSAGNAANNQLSAPINQTPVSGVWYLSDSTLSSSDLPITPTAAQSGFSQGGGFKIGNALSKGTVVFQCIIQQAFTNNTGLSPRTQSSVIWKVFYRDPNGTNTWNIIPDVNNFDMGAPGFPGNLVNNTFNASDAVGKQASGAFAFDEVGEYAVCATELITQEAAVNADAVCAWVNSNDLYYSDCVIENAVEVSDSGTPKAYKYDVSAAQTNYSCVATTSTHYYAPMPYAKYVDLFYSNVTLTTPVTPSSNEFRAFNTDVVSTEPFDQIKVSAKFGTDGVKIAPSVSEKICNSGAFALACQLGSTTCAQPMPGAELWV